MFYIAFFLYFLQPLPDFSRIKGVMIPGKAYADLLMVEEFVYCFGHVLDIGLFYICYFLMVKSQSK